MDTHHRLTLPRRLGGVLPTALLAAVLTLMALEVGLAAIGCRPLVIRSGSMQPTLAVGDVVISRRVDPGSLAPGQIVTFHDPTRRGALVTHRVVAVTRDGGTVGVETRGDANRVSERWSVPASGSVGRQVAHVPRIGWAFHALQSAWARIAAVLAVCGWFGGVLLRRIWSES